MIGDAFVFDAVAHLYNMTPANVRNSEGELFNKHLYGLHGALTPPGEKIIAEGESLREWDMDTIANLVFAESSTDMLVAQPLPLTDFFHDGLSDWRKCAEMPEKYLQRIVTWGTVNPIHWLPWQVNGQSGAKALSFLRSLPSLFE